MLCAYMRPRYQVSVYRTIGPLVLRIHWQISVNIDKSKTLYADSSNMLFSIQVIDINLLLWNHVTKKKGLA